MYIYIYIHIYICHIHIYIYIYAYIYIYIYIYNTYTYIRAYTYVRVCIYMCTHAYTNTYSRNGVGAGPTWEGHMGEEVEEDSTITVTFHSATNLAIGLVVGSALTAFLLRK